MNTPADPSFTGQKPPFTALPNWLRGRASAYEIAILWALQSYWPEIRPSHGRLASDLGFSRSTVIRTLAGMERKGWLVHSRRFLDQGGQMANVYELQIWEGEPGSQSTSGKTLFQLSPRAASGPMSQRDTPVSEGHTPCVSDAHPLCHTDTPPVSGGHTPCVCVTHEEELTKQEPTKEEPHEEEKPLEARANARRSAPVALRSIESGIQDQGEIQADPESRTQPKTPKPARGRHKAQEAASKSSRVSLPLPTCAEPFRELLAAWWSLRCRTHPKLPRVGLNSRSVNALLYAEQFGVLQQFCELASEAAWQSLGFNGYRQYIEKLAQDESQPTQYGTSGRSGFRTVSSARQAYPTSKQETALRQVMAQYAAEPCSIQTISLDCSQALESASHMPKLFLKPDSILPG